MPQKEGKTTLAAHIIRRRKTILQKASVKKNHIVYAASLHHQILPKKQQKTFRNFPSQQAYWDHHAFHEQNISTKRQYPIRGKTRKNQVGYSMQLCIHYSSTDRLSSCLNALQSYSCDSIVVHRDFHHIVRLKKN